MMQWILQTIASLFLGVLVLCSAILLFSTFVVTTVIRDDIYADALAEERAYSRLYSEVLTSQFVTDIRRKYILELALLPPEDIVDFVRDTAPPEYLQEQTESNLHRLSAYLKGESRQLHFYLDLSEPLERIPATLADLIEARAAESSKLLIHQANPIAADVTGQELAADIVTDLETLLDGGNPSRAVAEFTGKSREELLTIVDQALDEILANPDVPIAYRQALGDARPKLQSSFADDRSGDFLEVAIGVLVQPAVAAIVAGVDVELDDGNKLDLIPLLSQQVSDANGPTIQNTLGGWRDSATTAIFWGRIAALTMLLAAVGLMGLVHWGRPSLLVLWTGWALVISGALLLAGTLLALWQVPGAAHRATDQWLTATLPWAPGLAPLAAEVAEQALRNLLAGLLWPAFIPFLAGGLLLAALVSWERWKPHSQKWGASSEGSLITYNLLPIKSG